MTTYHWSQEGKPMAVLRCWPASSGVWTGTGWISHTTHATKSLAQHGCNRHNSGINNDDEQTCLLYQHAHFSSYWCGRCGHSRAYAWLGWVCVEYNEHVECVLHVSVSMCFYDGTFVWCVPCSCASCVRHPFYSFYCLFCVSSVLHFDWKFKYAQRLVHDPSRYWPVSWHFLISLVGSTEIPCILSKYVVRESVGYAEACSLFGMSVRLDWMGV